MQGQTVISLKSFLSFLSPSTSTVKRIQHVKLKIL